MTNGNRRKLAKIAHAMVGCDCFHRGEHGTIESADVDSYAEPMLVVRFGDRVAILKPYEIGAA